MAEPNARVYRGYAREKTFSSREEWEKHRVVSVHLEGEWTLDGLLTWLADNAPDSPEQIGVRGATLTWIGPATEEELAERAKWVAAHDARTEKYERETYARLKEKYGVDQ